MLENFNCRVALRSPAHITLIPPFRMYADKQQDFYKALDLLANSIEPFTIETGHFDSFGKRTLFLESVLSPPLKQLHSSINNWVKGHPVFGTSIDNRPFHPHITIANRDLTPDAFKAGKAYFAEQQAGLAWLAEGLGVLRLKKNWEVIHASQFLKDL
ncbi:MAG: hypothetical protein JWP88_2135 [Flaviaesturariibacter sp.]|nr:hypothetical protein [Flaviaesturariibacter sp.]